MDRPQTNEELQSHYEKLHAQGSSAWFSDGAEERQAILDVGEPWTGLGVLEIGCGEGDLCRMISGQGAVGVTGLDYSEAAIKTAQARHGRWHDIPEYAPMHFSCRNYHGLTGKWDRIVMQGVLEHLDNPWQELAWMIDNLLTPEGDLITSSPCFCNPRGIVWMTLATLCDAPMSLTDLHFLHPWNFRAFAAVHGMKISIAFCDQSWGNGEACTRDLLERLPKVLPDCDENKIRRLLGWLGMANNEGMQGLGATAVYHLRRK